MYNGFAYGIFSSAWEYRFGAVFLLHTFCKSLHAAEIVFSTFDAISWFLNKSAGTTGSVLTVPLTVLYFICIVAENIQKCLKMEIEKETGKRRLFSASKHFSTTWPIPEETIWFPRQSKLDGIFRVASDNKKIGNGVGLGGWTPMATILTGCSLQQVSPVHKEE